MNYIQEIKSFNDWLILNPSVSSDDIVLWYALMNLNNMSGWQKEFTVAISTIIDRTRLSRSAIYRSRNKLVQLGRIKTRERSGNQCSVYEVIPFTSHKGTHNGTDNGTQDGTDQQSTPFVSPNGTQSGTQSGTQTGTQSETDNGIISKTKLNETKQGVDSKGAAAPIAPIKKMFIKPTLDELETFFLKELVRLEFPSNNLDDEAKDYADSYMNCYNANGWKVGKNAMKDWKAAATNWVHRDLKKLKEKNYATHKHVPAGAGVKSGISERRDQARANY